MSTSQPKQSNRDLEATAIPGTSQTPSSEDVNVSDFKPNSTAAPNLDATIVGPGAAETPKSVAKPSAEPKKVEPQTNPQSKPSGEKKATQLGDFKLVKKLGQGGMGEVFLAHQVSLDRQVALKVMNKQFSKQENFVKRFKREAQTMAKLNHPNIVQGYAVGEEQGLLYLAMELVKGHDQGRSLQDWMNNQQKLEIGDAIHVTLIIADALKYANEMSLIHRDIKPDNMLITEKGVVKLSDMGLAKATDEDMSMTQSGAGLGTPYYMPPEQANNAKYVDHRSDIYALGCTLYYFLTGELPFKGTSAMELIMAKTKGTFARARSLNKEIPEKLDLILDKMIAKDPKSRYQTYDELIRDLQSLGRANPVLSFISSTGVVAAAAPASVMGGSTVNAGLNATVAKSLNGSGATTNAGPGATVSSSKINVQDNEQWYVLQTQPNGPPKKAKFTTGQIKQLLKSGALDGKMKACLTNSNDYRPLASYPAFEQVMKAKVVQAQAAKKSTDYDKLYKQIDRQQRWRPWVKWFKGFFDGVKGLISLLIYLAVLIGIGVGLWIYWPTIYAAIQSRAPGVLPSGQTAPAPTPAPLPAAPPVLPAGQTE